MADAGRGGKIRKAYKVYENFHFKKAVNSAEHFKEG
jgi:hypothetical protein